MRADWPAAPRRHGAAGRRRHGGERLDRCSSSPTSSTRRSTGRPCWRPPRSVRPTWPACAAGLCPDPAAFAQQLAMRAPLRAADGRSHPRAQAIRLARRGQPGHRVVARVACGNGARSAARPDAQPFSRHARPCAALCRASASCGQQARRGWPGQAGPRRAMWFTRSGSTSCPPAPDAGPALRRFFLWRDGGSGRIRRWPRPSK